MFQRLTKWFQAEEFPDTRAPWRIFWVAFAVRVLYMTIAHTYRIRPYEDHFQFGWEAGRIARALATGYGYADPFSDAVIRHTGPTAWLPPLYPLLLAGVFKIFGVYTATSAWVAFAINSALSGATAMLVWELAARSFSRRCALWSAWIYALHPAAMQYAVRWAWEMTLTTFLFTMLLVLALRMRNIGDPTPPRARNQLANWCLFGLLWGLIALSNSSLLLFLPFSALWILWGTWRRQHIVRDVVLASLICLACVAPWTIRNYTVFHKLIPMRGNLGVEMYLGNGPGSNGWLMAYDHPGLAPEQIRQYATLGEVQYSAIRGALAEANIRRDRAHYWAITGKRIYFFWASVPHPDDHNWSIEAGRVLNFGSISLSGLMGLALALYHRKPGAVLYAWAFLLLPIPYYLVTVHARFRHPLEPLICCLGVYLFQSAERHKTRSQPVVVSNPGLQQGKQASGAPGDCTIRW